MAPENDGGDPIIYYRSILYQGNIHREVQTIRVSPRWNNERQTISTSVPKETFEEQRVVCIPMSTYTVHQVGLTASSNRVEGAFRVCTNDYSDCTPRISPESTALEMEMALNYFLPFGRVVVSREVGRGIFALEWNISFVNFHGPVKPLMFRNHLQGTDVHLKNTPLKEGMSVDGFIRLGFGSTWVNLPYNASSSVAQMLLSEVPDYDMVVSIMNARTVSEKDVQNFCHFPFLYKGKLFESCTSADNHGIHWCSLQKVANRSKDGSWGNCSSILGKMFIIAFRKPGGDVPLIKIDDRYLFGSGTRFNVSHPDKQKPYTAVYTAQDGYSIWGFFKLEYGEYSEILPCSVSISRSSITMYTACDMRSYVPPGATLMVEEESVALDYSDFTASYATLKNPWSKSNVNNGLVFVRPKTRLIPVSASCEDVSDAIEALPDVDIDGVFCRCTVGPFKTRKWQIEFVGKNRNQGALSLMNVIPAQTNAMFKVTRDISGRTKYSAFSISISSSNAKIRGFFRLQLGSSQTKPLPWDSTSEAVKEELEERLVQIHRVSVRRSPIMNHGYTWNVTVLEQDQITENLQLSDLECDESLLNGQGAVCKIWFDKNPSYPFSGVYQLSFMGNRSTHLAFNTSNQTLNRLLNNMKSVQQVGGIRVHSVVNQDGGLVHTFNFLQPGNVEQFEAIESSKEHASIDITTSVQGYAQPVGSKISNCCTKMDPLSKVSG